MRGESDTFFRVQTPEGIEYSLYPAGPAIRACAYAIDTLFQTLAVGVLAAVFSFFLREVVGFWLLLLAKFVIDWFYHVIWELCARGQSPGKRFLGLRVVSGDGSPIGPGASFIRNLLRFADSFMGLYLPAFLSVLFSRGFRRLGDWAAGSLVIYTWQSQAPERPPSLDWLADVPPALPGRALSSEEKQGLLMFARRYPLVGPARADEIAGPLAESLAEQESVDGGGGAALAEQGLNGDAALAGQAKAFAGQESAAGGAAGAGLAEQEVQPSPSRFLLGIARGIAMTEGEGKR